MIVIGCLDEYLITAPRAIRAALIVVADEIHSGPSSAVLNRRRQGSPVIDHVVHNLGRSVAGNRGIAHVVACDVVVVDRDRAHLVPQSWGCPDQKAFPSDPVERLGVVSFRKDVPLEGDIS